MKTEKGFCECGCGNKTTIPTKTARPLNRVKGVPMRFIHGHGGSRRFRGGYSVSESGCWDWSGSKSPSGYPNKNMHRIFFVRKFGPIADGLEIDHACRNRGCVNPDHLEAVTHQENMRRARRIKKDDEAAIRAMSSLGISSHDIANRFGISKGHANRIIRGAAWA